jgi:hypothetical protein
VVCSWQAFPAKSNKYSSLVWKSLNRGQKSFVPLAPGLMSLQIVRGTRRCFTLVGAALWGTYRLARKNYLTNTPAYFVSSSAMKKNSFKMLMTGLHQRIPGVNDIKFSLSHFLPRHNKLECFSLGGNLVEHQWLYTQQFTLFVSQEWAQQDRVFFIGKPLQLGAM